ncbi:MAG: cell envelope integrity protein TolA [Janthinobacterium lividum]
MKPVTAGAPYRVPPEPSRLPAFMLAVAVHAVLLGFLWFGISWQTSEPVAVEAEVWDMSVQTAAAPELPPPPAPQPEPQPEPEPAPPPPRVVEPPPVERPAPAQPDIKLQREKELKERKEREQRELAEKKEREERVRKEEEAREKKLAEQKKREDAEREKKELAKKEAEKKEAEKKEADKKKAEKLAADKAAKEKAEKAAKAEAAKLEKFRQDELKRIAGAMGSTGSAAKSTAPKADAGYVAAITAAIKSNTAYGGSTTMPGNPKAVFKVEQLPTGEIMSVRLVKSSGVPEFDRAVENGIKKASPLPKKKDGTVERTLDVNFSMKDYD